MSTKIAKAISFIFNPLIMPILGLLIIFHSGTYLSYIPFEGKRLLFYIILGGTFLIPVCFIPLYIYFKVIDTIEVQDRYQRSVPLLITCILYFFTFYILRNFPIPFINLFIFASAASVLVNLIVNFWWKISSHLIAIGGLTGLIAVLFIRLNADIFSSLIIILLISGLIGFSRIKLEAHSPWQVYAGFFVGLLTVGGIMMI